jgi:hypothetical protein
MPPILTAEDVVKRTGPVGVVFASCATASVIRRQIAGAVMVALGRELVGARGAFPMGALAIPLEHQARGPPDVDVRYHRTKVVSARSGK